MLPLNSPFNWKTILEIFQHILEQFPVLAKWQVIDSLEKLLSWLEKRLYDLFIEGSAMHKNKRNIT